MRILYHRRTLGDGAEGIHIAEMVAAFRELGHDVRVLGLAAAAPATAGAGALARVRPLLPGPIHEIAGAVCNAAEYRAVRRAIDDLRPDLLYKRHARNDVAALAAAKSRGVPSVLEVNCLYSSPAYRRFEPLAFGALTAGMERRALSLASVVVAVSTPLAQEIQRLGAANVQVVPNGANPVTFRPSETGARAARTRLGLPDALTLGWAGIIREWHGLELLLDVLDRVSGAVLLVIGDGPGRGRLEAAAAGRGLAGRVVVTGRVPHRSMADYLQTVDIAVVADERTGIASPMKLLEYMAMGLSVVAPDVPNIRDLVSPGIEGMLFRPGDALELSETVARLAADPALRRRLGARARLKIERDRNWRHNAELVLGFVTGDGPSGHVRATGALKGQHV